MALVARVFTWRASQDGTLDGHYRLGDKPPGVGTIAWTGTLQSLVNLTTGTPLSVNVRSLLSGNPIAIALTTITLITVSGDDAASEGWAIVGDNLTHPGNNTGAGFLKLRATFLGNSIDRDPSAWSWVAPAAVDTLAPTIPTGFTVTPINGGVTIAHDASSDSFDGTVPAALVQDYRVRKDGVVIQTQTSGVTAGLSPTYTATNLGSIASPAPPVAIQTGAQWSLQAAGTGIHGTLSDQCLFVNADFSGDFTLVAKLESFSSSNQYSTSGIMIRESNAVNAPFVAVYLQPASPGNGLQVKRRATSANVSANRASVAGITAAYVRLRRVGADITASYSLDGGAWTNIITVSDAPMAADVKAGAFLSSQLAGTSCNAVVSQLNGNNAPELSYNVLTTGAGTFTVSCRDIALNESAVSLAIAATPLIVAPPAITHRALFGHYVFFTVKVLNPNTSTGLSNQAALFALIDSIAQGRTGFDGIQLILSWRDLEGPTRGDYTRAWQILDPIFAKLAAVSPAKNLILQVFDRGFVGNTSTVIIPQYLINEGEFIEAPAGETYSGGLKCCASIWHAATMTDWINLGKAIAARYNDNPRFAMYCGGETTLGFPSGVSDFTQSAFNTQLRRCYTELKPVFTKCPLRLNGNYYGTPAEVKSLIDFCHTTVYTGGIVIGGPDPEFDQPLPANLANAHRTITFNEVFRGNTQITVGTETNWQQGGGTDYRGRIPWIAEWQEFGMSDGRVGFNESVADIYAGNAGAPGAQNCMNASYHVWLQQNYKDPTTVAGNQRWLPYPTSGSANGVKYFVESVINGAVALSNPAIFEGSWA